MFKSLKKESRATEVLNQLSEAIEKGMFKVGEKLPSERELTEQFGVSRATVREALANLRSMGFIRIQRGPNSGSYVAAPGTRTITKSLSNLVNLNKLSFTQLLEARLLIEPDTAGTAARIRDEKDVKRLEDKIEQTRKGLSKSLSEVRKLNVSFHLEIANILKNPIIFYITESIVNLYTKSLIDMTRFKMKKTQVLDRIEEHASICQAIKNGDAALARKLVTTDIVDVQQSYLKMVPSLQDQDENGLIQHWLDHGKS